MKILFFLKTISSLKKKDKIGGIEILNLELYNFLKKKFKVSISNKPNNKHKKISWDIIISSNYAQIFDIYKSKRNILWLHNKLQIEKALRKKQFFSIIKNKIDIVFVSKYLENLTSKLYFFNKRYIIPNFITKIFLRKRIKLHKNYKPIFIWTVQRDRGLKELIDIWKSIIIKKYPLAELHIFSVNGCSEKLNNIFFHGRVDRLTLIKFYKKAKAMICLGYDETFCLNAVESFSQGLPIISFGKTALREIVINNINGHIVNDFSDLKNVIFKYINLNGYKYEKLRLSSFNYSKKFYPDKIFNMWIDLLKTNTTIN